MQDSGSLVFRAPHLTGDREPYSRFGYAMANLGDINGDGLEGKDTEHLTECALTLPPSLPPSLPDVAISAPYGTGPGKVFIYTGSLSTIISQSPAQVCPVYTQVHENQFLYLSISLYVD